MDRMSPVYRIADLSSLWLEISVPREKMAAVQPGMKVAIAGYSLDSPPVVTNIARSIDPDTQAITVRATLERTWARPEPGRVCVSPDCHGPNECIKRVGLGTPGRRCHQK